MLSSLPDMRQDRKRHMASWVLLAVFVPMLLLSSLHIHSHALNIGIECVDCVTHTPHAGHITDGAWHMDTCVLCQFLAITFLSVAVLAVLPLQRLITYLSVASVHCVTSDVCGYKSVRAPPSVF